MPAKGTKKLSAKKKAEIIATKRVTNGRTEDIAKQFKVSRSVVRKAEQTASPAALALADQFEDRILKLAKSNAEVGLEIIGKRLTDPDEPLSSINTSVKLSHEIYRLETGQATQIVDRGPVDKAIEYGRQLIERGKLSLEEAAIELRQAEFLSKFGVSAADRERAAEELGKNGRKIISNVNQTTDK